MYFLKLCGWKYPQGTYTLQPNTEKSAVFLPFTGIRSITYRENTFPCFYQKPVTLPASLLLSQAEEYQFPADF